MFTSDNFSGEHLEDVWNNGHHTRHWIDANGLDNGEAVYVPSHAEFQERTTRAGCPNNATVRQSIFSLGFDLSRFLRNRHHLVV